MGRPNKRKTTIAHPAESTRSDWSSSSYLHVRYSHCCLSLSLPLPSFIVAISLRLQEQTCYKFNGNLIQGSYFSLRTLNPPNRRGEPNAIGRHSSPDLPPHTIPRLTKRVTSCPLYSSTRLIHKLF